MNTIYPPCDKQCPHRGKKHWPSHLAKPMCRVSLEHDAEHNPVTQSVLRNIMENKKLQEENGQHVLLNCSQHKHIVKELK